MLLTWIIQEFKSLPSVFTPEEKRDEIHEENNHDQTHTDEHFLQQEGFRGNTRHSRSNNNTEITRGCIRDYISDSPFIECHIRFTTVPLINNTWDNQIFFFFYLLLSIVTCAMLLQIQWRKLLNTFQGRNMTISSASLILFT